MQANLERNKIGKKIGKVDRKQNLYMPIIVLSLMILASSLLFLFMGINKGSMDYALSKRIPRLIAIILTGGCIGFSTIIFQTITDNRILTPNVMGIDSLYVAIQTMLIFAFGSSSAFVSNKKINFLICLVFMILGTSLLYKLIFKKDNANIIFVLLICILVLGIIFLLKLNKTISNVLEILENNKKNIEYTCDKLPVVSKNMVEITDNIKDISEVATDFTADAIVTKENIINNYDMVKEIFKIIKSVFIK